MRLTGGVRSQVDASFFSLGSTCQVAFHLKRHGLRAASLPFDWGISTCACAFGIIDADFSGLFDDLELVRRGNTLTLLARPYGLRLPHDVERFRKGGAAAVIARYASGIEAFQGALRGPAPVVVVRQGIALHEARQLRDRLVRASGGQPIAVVGVNYHAESTRILREHGPGLTSFTVPRVPGAGWMGPHEEWDWVLEALRVKHLRGLTRTTMSRLASYLSPREWQLVTSAVRPASPLTQAPSPGRPQLRRALVAAEDHRFARHRGVDLRALARAAFGVLTRRPLGGGSTVHQQLVRVVTNQRERTLKRKLRELILARALGSVAERDAILDAYLRSAYFGAGMLGVRQAAAAMGYDFRTISDDQAVTLLAMLKYPRPRTPSPAWHVRIMRRADYIRARSLRLGL